MVQWQKGELIKESRWSRLYRTGPRDYYSESKFLLDGLRADPSSIKREWNSFSDEEKVDFGIAFAAGAAADKSPEVEEILTFLMSAGPEEVWMNIAGMLPKHSDKEAVMRFLLERLQTSQEPAYCFQALAGIGDQRAVPLLRQDYERRLTRINEAGVAAVSEFDWCDFYGCCAVLWKLGAEGPFETRVHEALSHPSDIVRVRVGVLLES